MPARPRCLPWILAAALLGLLPTAQAAGPGQVRAVAQVDAGRFAGTWYEVARLPNRFQADCASDVTANYQPLPDGSLQVVNSCRTPTGKVETDVGRAWSAIRQPGNAARLKVSFMPRWLQWLPVGKGDFWVVMLDPGYRFAVISEPTRQNLWVLSRTPAMPAEVLGGIVDRLHAEGYPTAQLVLTRQSASVRGVGAGRLPPPTLRPRLIVRAPHALPPSLPGDPADA